MPPNFADRLLDAVRAKQTPLCVGLDPVYACLPAEIVEHKALNDESDVEAALDAVLEFCRRVIRLVAPLVPAVKINSAFFERYYWEGLEGYFDLVQEAAERDLIVIGDVKRGDIGHSAEQYARACLGDPTFLTLDDRVAPDAVTVNPYFGLDGVKPFIDVAREEQKGIFVLVRTSNETAGELQHLTTADGLSVADCLAGQVSAWAADEGLIGESGYSCVGAVVSTRNPEEAKRLRTRLERSIFLIPGYGAQGLGAEAVAALFKPDGTGAIVNASRSIIYAYQDPELLESADRSWEKSIELACKNSISELAGSIPSS